ncbi:hypothetical protein BDR05DRAFT_1006053 [Suillus weaverae]|nr:hypothetical protein BDR05DRAFT_1006053 [Suillus weaverae]
MPGSPMNEDNTSYHSADLDTDKDMRSHSTGSTSADMGDDEEATCQGDADGGEEDGPEYLNGEEDSDDEADEDAGSELEDKCSEFGYGDLEERIIEDDGEDSNEDDGDNDSEIDLGAEDGEGAADNEEDYDDYGEY